MPQELISYGRNFSGGDVETEPDNAYPLLDNGMSAFTTTGLENNKHHQVQYSGTKRGGDEEDGSYEERPENPTKEYLYDHPQIETNLSEKSRKINEDVSLKQASNAKNSENPSHFSQDSNSGGNAVIQTQAGMESQIQAGNESQTEPTEQPFYVNAKQYYRILKRRYARAKLEENLKISRERRPYLHESRHKHAMRRPRGQGGRFLTAAEMAEMKRKEEEASGKNTVEQDVPKLNVLPQQLPGSVNDDKK